MKTHKFDRRAVSVTVAVLVVLTGCSTSTAPGAKTVTRNEAITRPVRVSGDDRTLTVVAESGGCDSLPRLHVSETPKSVVLTVRITTRTGPGVVCPADARIGPARATLHTVLGTRTVTDGTTGRRLSIRKK
ncbi:hypothetical protein ACIHEJ_38395 [Streptomyces sp. NPDC052301]|uniref:hypothetical protein n=1 Tax=Streptomyces sp. NPDC052301 TaxID=3365687 RepID=UPI0037D15467